jgi:signal transduction histidine kinase
MPVGNSKIEKIEVWISPSGDKASTISQDNIPGTSIAVFTPEDDAFQDLLLVQKDEELQLNISNGTEESYPLEGNVSCIRREFTSGEMCIYLDVTCRYGYDAYTNFMVWYYSGE